MSHVTAIAQIFDRDVEVSEVVSVAVANEEDAEVVRLVVAE